MLLFFNLGGGEIFIVLMAVLLLFGSKKIPEFAKGLGKGIRQFKDTAGDLQKDINNSIHDVKRTVEEEREKIEKK
ncbi:MAG: twin-arginine translocase TatA/TatE family subunit [Flavobacteriales bacterium]|nr:twin-arginine translocase TatA/TatE family subunit [Flavobacteriales bacterium]